LKRTVFRNRWLPYALVAPQLAVTMMFFFWPAGKSLYLSLFMSPPFGGRDVFVGLANFSALVTTPDYYDSVINSFIFSGGVTVFSVVVSLVVAGLANQKIRGLAIYRTALLWPTASRPRWPGSSSSSSSIPPTACSRTSSPS
jgi:sn-glycerol 3-phosphate transport system permease protein